MRMLRFMIYQLLAAHSKKKKKKKKTPQKNNNKKITTICRRPLSSPSLCTNAKQVQTKTGRREEETEPRGTSKSTHFVKRQTGSANFSRGTISRKIPATNGQQRVFHITKVKWQEKQAPRGREADRRTQPRSFGHRFLEQGFWAGLCFHS
jgi:hypothetical protein